MTLQLDPRNARRHSETNKRRIKQSLDAVGAGRSVLADADGIIRAGNGVFAEWGDKPVKIVETDGTELVVVQRTDLRGKDAVRAAALDNIAADSSAYDYDAKILAEIAKDDALVAALAKEDAKLAELLRGEAKQEPKDAGELVDKAAELQAKWQVKRGDLWECGKHRILCGDSTNAADVQRLMGGEKAQLCFTSPPYNAGVSAQLRGNTHLQDSLYVGDSDDKSQSDYLSFLGMFTTIALELCDYVFVNIQPLAGNKFALLDYWHAFKEQFCDVAIWDKIHAAPAMARRVMNSQFEFILMFSAKNQSRSVGTQDWRGTVSNVYQGQPQRNNEAAEIHGATMPLHLPVWILNTFMNLGETVYEPFLGTGTTLVACEQTGRVGRGMEIEPRYVSVSLERLAGLGLNPQRIESGI